MADKDKDAAGKDADKVETPENPDNNSKPEGEDPKVDPKTPPEEEKVDWQKEAEKLKNEKAGVEKLQSEADKKLNTLKETFDKMAESGITPENAAEFKTKLEKAESETKLLAQKLKIGAEAGLPTGLIDRIKDGSEEDMKADAEIIKKLLNPEPTKHEFAKEEPTPAPKPKADLQDDVDTFLAKSGKPNYQKSKE